MNKGTKYLVYCLSLILGIFIGRSFVFFTASLFSSFVSYASFYANLFAAIFMIISIIGIILISRLHKEHKYLKISNQIFKGGIIASITILITFYGRGIDTIGHWHNGLDTFQREYHQLFKDADGRVGIISNWGNIIIEQELDTGIELIFDNETKQELIVGIIGMDSMYRHEGAPVIVNFYSLNGNLVKHLSFSYAENSEFTVGDLIKSTYGESVHVFYWLTTPIKGPTTETQLNKSEFDNKENSTVNNSDNSYNSSYEHEDNYAPKTERHETTVPVQVWHDCTNCFGSRQCPYCYGQGRIVSAYGDYQDCPVCTDGLCVICGGRGGHYETEYQTRVEYY